MDSDCLQSAHFLFIKFTYVQHMWQKDFVVIISLGVKGWSALKIRTQNRELFLG